MSKTVLILIILTSSNYGLTSGQSLGDNNDREPDQVIRDWQSMEKTLGNALDTIIKQALPFLVNAGSELDLSPECYEGLTSLLFGVKQQKSWAFRMLDASGKLPSGLMSGSFTELGSYDQCLDIAPSEKGPKGFRGQYCLISLKIPLPKKPEFYRLRQELPALRDYNTTSEVFQELKKQASVFYLLSLVFGACTPSSCTTQDLQQIVNSVSTQIHMKGLVTSCEIKEDPKLTNGQLAIIITTSIFLSLVIASSIIHWLFHKGQSTWWKKLAKGMSLPENIRKTFAVGDEVDSKLSCLHGIKFLSISWVVLGHTYFFLNWQQLHNASVAYEIAPTFLFQTIANATVSVDSFFFITGVLICYLCVNLVSKHGPAAFNVPIYIFHRFWRIVPSTLVVVGFFLLTPLVGSGPFFKATMTQWIENCNQNWWPILLSANNFLHPLKMCLPHTWYTSCDMQLFLFAVVFLWMLFKKKNCALYFAIVLIIGSVIVPGIVTYVMKYPPTMLVANIDFEQRSDFWHINYFQFYPHLGPYAMGLLLGWYIAKTDKKKIALHYRVIGWTLAILCNGSVLYSTMLWNGTTVPTVWESVVYSSLHRLGWSLGLTWIVLMCAWDYGGPINAFLGHKAFLPLSRLSFMIFLLHYTVMWMFSSTYRSTADASQIFAIYIWFANLNVTTLLAFVFRVLFECPLLELERLLISYVIEKIRSKHKHADIDLTNRMENHIQ